MSTLSLVAAVTVNISKIAPLIDVAGALVVWVVSTVSLIALCEILGLQGRWPKLTGALTGAICGALFYLTLAGYIIWT